VCVCVCMCVRAHELDQGGAQNMDTYMCVVSYIYISYVYMEMHVDININM